MHDLDIRLLNDGGEVGIRALTARAQDLQRLPAGLTVAFKSLADARLYIFEAEKAGLTFRDEELLLV
ncbi:MAG: hypothetical protein ACHP84_01070 [Caulobacterales bacterium]